MSSGLNDVISLAAVKFVLLKINILVAFVRIALVLPHKSRLWKKLPTPCEKGEKQTPKKSPLLLRAAGFPQILGSMAAYAAAIRLSSIRAVQR